MARALNVDQEWLAWGVERMSPLTRAPLRGYVGAGDEVEWFDEPLAAEAAQGRMLISPGVRLEALEVRGDSQWPRFLSGETILFDARPRPPQELAGHFAVVQTDKGSRMVKILRGSNKGANKWRLESLNAPPLDDVDVLWAHNVIGAVVGAREAASAWPTGLGSRRPKSRRELTGGQLRLLREGMVATLAAAGTQRSDAEILVTDLFARIGEGPPPPLPPPSSGPPPPIAQSLGQGRLDNLQNQVETPLATAHFRCFPLFLLLGRVDIPSLLPSVDVIRAQVVNVNMRAKREFTPPHNFVIALARLPLRPHPRKRRRRPSPPGRGLG